MPLVRITPKPGINTQLSQVQNADGWFASNLIRWKFGLPEKIGGWVRLFDDVCSGFVRELHAWLDLSDNQNLLIGTDAGPQILVNGTLYSLTLLSQFAQGGSGATLTNFSVTNGSAVVTVAVPSEIADELIAGQSFTTMMKISVGGRIIPTGSVFVISTVGATSFTFTMTQVATTTSTNVVGITLFDSTPSVSTITATLNAHGMSTGNTFHIDQTTSALQAVGTDTGWTIPGDTDVTVIVTGANTFTFSGTPFMTFPTANASAYEGTQQTDTDTTYGTVLSFGLTTGVLNPNLQLWSMDNLGEIGLLVYTHSALYIYQQPISGGTELNPVGSGTPATAPQSSHGMLVAMPQAQVLLWGTETVLGSGTIDPLLIRFSDVGTYDTWTATASNQAGSYRLSRGSKIVGAIQAPQTTLAFTDTDVWSMSYQGPPLVYGFTIVGVGCGLLAPRAVAVVGRTTYWLGRNGFWLFGESGVRPLPCPVWDIIFRDLDYSNAALAFAASNTGFNEVTFYYPSLEDAPDPPTNKLVYSEVFSNGAWITTGAAPVNALLAPDSTTSATKLVEDTTTGEHRVAQTVATERVAQTLTFALYAQTTSTRWLQMTVTDSSLGGSNAELQVNPIAGTVIAASVTGWTLVTSGVTTDVYATGLAGNGWLRYFITFTTTASSTVTVVINNMVASSSTISYAGNGTGNVYMWGAQLNEGTLTAYEASTLLLTNNPTRYVKCNVAENLWDYGQLERTAWLDDSIMGSPLGADFNFRIQQHEIGYDDDTEPMRDVSIETGYGTVSDGSVIMMVDQCQPDMTWFGQDGGVTLTLKTLKYPGGPQQQYGPYSVTPTTQFFSTRTRAKLMAMRCDWAPILGYSARVGATAFRVKPAGTRP
jgi:hypothetical protein